MDLVFKRGRVSSATIPPRGEEIGRGKRDEDERREEKGGVVTEKKRSAIESMQLQLGGIFTTAR